MAGEGYAAADFQIDWDNQQATCPQGHTNQAWIATSEKGQPRVRIKFSQKTCRPCPVRIKCTQTKQRSIFLRADEHYQALQAARQRDSQANWSLLYNQRSGIEGSLSPGVRGFGMPHRRTGPSRYIGLAKTHLQNMFVTTAMNLWRIADWLNEVPLAKTRQASFMGLMSQIMVKTEFANSIPLVEEGPVRLLRLSA